MNQVNAIELRNLSKRFGKVVANDRINLSVRHGEIMAILGENGSGKTTLMNMISGIYYPDEGEIYVNGELATIRSPKDAFPLGIGMIHQHFKLVDVLTAAENIVLGLPGSTRLNIRDGGDEDQQADPRIRLRPGSLQEDLRDVRLRKADGGNH